MSAFWIFGIILNVTLTALAIYWAVKQMRRRDDKSDERGPVTNDSLTLLRHRIQKELLLP